MFGTVDRELVKQHPFLLINGEICKFENFVSVEDNSQKAIFKSLAKGTVYKLSTYEFNNCIQDAQITAQGLCFELMLEIKNMIELNNLGANK